VNDRGAGGQPASHPFRWVLFGAMCVVYFAFGVILLAIPPMVSEVRADLGISRGMLGFALGAWALLYIVTAPPAGQIIDRLGLRRSLAAGPPCAGHTTARARDSGACAEATESQAR